MYAEVNQSIYVNVRPHFYVQEYLICQDAHMSNKNLFKVFKKRSRNALIPVLYCRSFFNKKSIKNEISSILVHILL